jgi:hypothetical protein
MHVLETKTVAGPNPMLIQAAVQTVHMLEAVVAQEELHLPVVI